jgi:hypothetical protein
MISINDIEILKRAVKIMGLVWKEGQTTYKWYADGRDTKAKTTLESSQGICEHAIGFAPGQSSYEYEIGVVKNKDGEGWKLVFDPYDVIAASKVGNQCEKLINEYSQAYIRDFAERNGFTTEVTTDAEGNLCMTLTGN